MNNQSGSDRPPDDDFYKWSAGPFDKDVLEEKKGVAGRPEEPLSEKDFIQESPTTSKIWAIPLWIWLALLTIGIALLWGSLGSIQEQLKHLQKRDIESKPFLEVSNRDFSLFLWQFPLFMKGNAKEKSGYLPGFQALNKENVDLGSVEEYVAAPPEVLFLYHAWNRLLASEFIERDIPSQKFKEFLNQIPEWKPENWTKAPFGYVEFINSGKYLTVDNLKDSPLASLPMEVRKAFQGWRNYFDEGPEINNLIVTYSQVKDFLKKSPHYARNYWRNIQEVNGKEVAGPTYLYSLESHPADKNSDIFPDDELAPFLKVALYNSQMKDKISKIGQEKQD